MRRKDFFPAADLCLLFTIVAVASGAVVYLFLRNSPSPLADLLTPEHLAITGAFNTGAKVKAYQVALLSIGVCWLIGAWLFRAGPPAFRSGALNALVDVLDSLRESRAGLIVVAGSVVWLSGSPWGKPGYFVLLSLSIAVAVCFSLAEKIERKSWYRRALWSFIVIYVALFTIPGLLATPDLTHCDMNELAGVEWHMSMTVGQGDRYAAGQRVFSDFIPQYGYVMPALNGFIHRTVGDFSLGGQMLFVKCLQVIFAILALVAYRLWKPGHPMLILACFLLVMPDLSTFGWPVYQPNSSGWRFLSFPVVVTALLVLRKRPVGETAAILGACSCFSVLFAPETGVALTAGNCMFLACRSSVRRPRDFLKLAGKFALGFALASAAYLGMFRAAFGYWPLPDTLDQVLFLAVRNLSGYTGTEMKFDPLPWLIFLHSAYIVLKTSMEWRNRPLSFRTSFRAAIAATLVVWFVYWFNRSDRLHLWTQIFLYSFLVDVFWDSCKASRIMKQWRSKAPLWRPVMLVMIIAPHMLAVNYLEARALLGNIRSAVEGRGSDVVTVSGVWVPADIGRTILGKAEFVKADASSRSILYLTGNSYLTPKLSGVRARLPVQEVFAETVTKEDYRRLLNRIVELAPDEILFDAPDAGELRASFYGRMRKDLSARYQLAGKTNGWEVWRKRRSP